MLEKMTFKIYAKKLFKNVIKRINLKKRFFEKWFNYILIT